MAELFCRLKLRVMDCLRAGTVRVTGLAGVLLLPIGLLAQEASDTQTRFASRNAVEKICLKLTHDGAWKHAAGGRFRMTSSNCTIDRDFSGGWQKRGDTLVLNTDRRPFFRVLADVQGAETPSSGAAPDAARTAAEAEPKANSIAEGKLRLQLSASDPALLRGMRVQADAGPALRWGRGTLDIPAQTRSLRFVVPGMDPVHVVLDDPELAGAFLGKRLFLHLEFADLYVPALVDDRWMLDGRILRYIPREASVRSEAIELKKGKKCWYKP